MTKKRFVPPTIEQCEAYVAEKGYQYVNGKAFWYWYDAIDWVISKSGTKMVRWHSAMGGWEEREQKKHGKEAQAKICVVCKRLGHRYQTNNKEQKVWLCELCKMFINAAGVTAWGRLSVNVIERKVHEGKAKLRH